MEQTPERVTSPKSPGSGSLGSFAGLILIVLLLALTGVILLVRTSANVRSLAALGLVTLEKRSGAQFRAAQKLLALEAGYDADALVLSVERQDYSTAELLLLMGVNPDARARSGRPVLHIAARAGDERMVQMLLANGARPAEQDALGASALNAAAAGGRAGIAENLLRHGAAVDSRGSDGNTALMTACAAKNGPLVSLLLRNGADPELRNEAGTSVREFLRRAGPEIEALLLPENPPAGTEAAQAQSMPSPAPVPVQRKRETRLRIAENPQGTWQWVGSYLRLADATVWLLNAGEERAEEIEVSLALPQNRRVRMSGPLELGPNKRAAYRAEPNTYVGPKYALRVEFRCSNCRK